MTKKIEIEESYQPVAFDPKSHAAKKRKAAPAFRAAYDALEDEFAALSGQSQTFALSRNPPALCWSLWKKTRHSNDLTPAGRHRTLNWRRV